jgi:hypothetical protein
MLNVLESLKGDVVKHCLLLLTILSVCACGGGVNNAESKQELGTAALSLEASVNTVLTEAEYSLQSQYLEQALKNTPYAALVTITKVDVIDLPDTDPANDYFEQKLIYHAEVLQSFKDNENAKISYIMYIEAGDTLDYPKEPFIITLCESIDGLYWPGVGASFSANERLISLAQQYSNNLHSSQDNSNALADTSNKLSEGYSHCQ